MSDGDLKRVNQEIAEAEKVLEAMLKTVPEDYVPPEESFKVLTLILLKLVIGNPDLKNLTVTGTGVIATALRAAYLYGKYYERTSIGLEETYGDK